MVSMIPLAVGVIYKSFRTNDDSLRFLKKLIICLVTIGVIFGVLAWYSSQLFAIVDVLIAPALFIAIRKFGSVNEDSVEILKQANKTLRGARNQAEIEHRISKEISLEEQRGG
ncbi:MAG: hypothetical protein H8D32_01020 [Dehalococcoidia bacterium]|nr:hypothetical protein [Dehalococcoidia bacterium]